MQSPSRRRSHGGRRSMMIPRSDTHALARSTRDSLESRDLANPAISRRWISGQQIPPVREPPADRDSSLFAEGIAKSGTGKPPAPRTEPGFRRSGPPNRSHGLGRHGPESSRGKHLARPSPGKSLRTVAPPPARESMCTTRRLPSFSACVGAGVSWPLAALPKGLVRFR